MSCTFEWRNISWIVSYLRMYSVLRGITLFLLFQVPSLSIGPYRKPINRRNAGEIDIFCSLHPRTYAGWFGGERIKQKESVREQGKTQSRKSESKQIICLLNASLITLAALLSHVFVHRKGTLVYRGCCYCCIRVGIGAVD